MAAVTRLNCPECGKVLRPARPVAPGKKVKCPECDTIFVAGEDDEDEPPRKSSGKGKKAAPPPKKKEAPKKKEEEEVFGYIRDEDNEDDEDDKPQINYVPDESVKDLRGPAIVILTGPSTKLQLLGMFAVFGWLGLFVLLIIPTLFPITPDEQEKEKAKQEAALAASGQGDKKAAAKKGPAFFEVLGTDLGTPQMFLIMMVPMILLGLYSALVVSGGIKAQNLESRGWGITASVMSMLPLHMGGVMMVTFLVIQWGGNLIMDDPDFVLMMCGIFMGLEYLVSLVVGGWLLKTLMDEDVIAGFEFDPE